MADLVMGAMSSLMAKLAELLKAEYNLQAGVKEQVKSLYKELEGAQAALRKVGQVPWDQLDEQVKLWSCDIREASYDMEDTLDTFIVRVRGCDSAVDKGLLKSQVQRVSNFIRKNKARRDISIAIQHIKRHVQEVTARHGRFKVDDVVARPATASTVDPRLSAMYTQVNKLVGISKSSSELMSLVQSSPQQDHVSNAKMKTISVFGPGGLGKTTLVKAVCEKLSGHYGRSAFVSVGRTPDLKKVIQAILIKLDKEQYMNFNFAVLHEISQFIDELRDFLLQHKRYFIVIDDIWETQSWDTIQLAFDDDNSCGGKIIITTRNWEVAAKAGEVYKLQPLPYDDSRKLFSTRIYGHDGRNCIDNHWDHTSDEILRKCDGIPLAIITMASLLVGKQREKWSEIYKSIGFGLKDNKEAESTKTIVSFSYYDLPSHLRSCLVYLSAFPEDCYIPKDELIWKWIAEGFVHERQGIRLFEIGESYFNDLINRCMIQAEEHSHDGSFHGCRVHDMVLDFIRWVSYEENFLTISDKEDDNGQCTLKQNTVRRLAQQNRAMGLTRRANRVDMRKARSFIGYECVIEKSIQLSSFNILHVLAIENCKPKGGCCIRIQHLGHLHHLRYLSLRGTKIDKIPREIGDLRLLQMLNLAHSDIVELPSSMSSLTQLLSLRITLSPNVEVGKEVASVGKMTSLEELRIHFQGDKWSARQLVKELRSLIELRVLSVTVNYDKEIERDLLESLPHLQKLQHLAIFNCFNGNKNLTVKWETEFTLPQHLQHLRVNGVATSLEELAAISSDKMDVVESLGEHVNSCYQITSCYHNDKFPTTTWEGAGFVLSSHLRELYIVKVKLSKLPSWISPSCLPNLSYLGLFLDAVDQQDLKILGTLPELCFLDLISRSSATISNVNDSDAGYFQKLRICRMSAMSMVWLLPGNDGKSLSFHIWNGKDDIVAMSSGSGRTGAISRRGTVGPTFMPHLKMLSFLVCVRALRDRCYSDNFGLEYIPSLQKIAVEILYSDASTEEVDQVKAALRHAANVHPNRPVLVISKFDTGNIIPREEEEKCIMPIQLPEEQD